MGRGGRIGIVVALAVVLAGSVGAAAFAKNIVGTARSETIRGTALADTIYGRDGNDRLIGLGGNDYLHGGPGNDRFVCGSGRDRVVAQRGESVARDCEVVKRVALPRPPQPPTPPPPPPPPPTPPPAPPQALTGTYCGFTDSGGGICLEVGGSGTVQYVTTGRFEQTTNCTPDSRFQLSITMGTEQVTLSSLRFTHRVTDGDLAGSEVSGTFDTQGNVTGTLFMKAALDYEGTRYTCESKTTWSAKIQR
jgi:Ca2+-binding RTX toxin-like protein